MKKLAFSWLPLLICTPLLSANPIEDARKKLVQIELPDPTVFDGMAAANGSISHSLSNGGLIGMKGK